MEHHLLATVRNFSMDLDLCVVYPQARSKRNWTMFLLNSPLKIEMSSKMEPLRVMTVGMAYLGLDLWETYLVQSAMLYFGHPLDLALFYEQYTAFSAGFYLVVE